MTLTVLHNALLFDGQSPDLVDDTYVVIEDDRIKEVGQGGVVPKGDQVIDLGGQVLMPGLIDAHVHLIATTADLGSIGNDPASLTAMRGGRIAEGMLQRGFTAVRDAGGADWGMAMAIEEGLIAGPRLFYSGRVLSQTGGHGDSRPRVYDWEGCQCCLPSAQFTAIADGVDEVRKAARTELRRGATQIKIMASGGVASPTDPIWNLQYSEEEIAAAVWEATSWRTYVMAHAYTPEAISRCVRLGVRSIEHGNLIDRASLELMREKDAWLVPTLVTYNSLHKYGADYGLPPVSVAKVDDVRIQGLEALALAHEMGVNIGLGTDLLGGMHKDQSNEFVIRAQVMPEVDVLRSATSQNAKLLNMEGELGVVASGAYADLIAVRGNPLEDISCLDGQGEALSLILKGGVILKNDMA
ncbi:MAG: amidohydrolase family protein [Rhodospirillaceae bacterium]|jgi:imidazolonepropionase-like amidohydrolase|nr:amidohydrolase family protein [Rhodospirillaceae bacterium]MBT4044994.1 amidohydrolase family protein [Rhodospirillaceae bacterium]MBT4687672.1 amidohydrolase family protein [Rhodospirillaceae bacterium]MBT5082904.1 amidohydrolase family protein [Rhodospirillaceae bacterium]MBT5524348.1 amidohydrolase family protein [Rhodospirillaceae bacterium]